MRSELRPTLVLLALLTALTGGLYTAAVTGVAQALFPGRANGSLVVRDGRAVGSELIGQPFDDARWFWPRPSATARVPYDAAASAGSNLGPTNPALVDAVKERVRALRESDPGNPAPLPVDLVTASASGLDPHVSPAAAHWQVRRVARARGLPEAHLHALVDTLVERSAGGLLGPDHVSVLALNLALAERGTTP